MRKAIEVWEKEWDAYREAMEADPVYKKPLPYFAAAPSSGKP
jgi:hypothetical protein